MFEHCSIGTLLSSSGIKVLSCLVERVVLVRHDTVSFGRRLLLYSVPPHLRVTSNTLTVGEVAAPLSFAIDFVSKSKCSKANSMAFDILSIMMAVYYAHWLLELGIQRRMRSFGSLFFPTLQTTDGTQPLRAPYSPVSTLCISSMSYQSFITIEARLYSLFWRACGMNDGKGYISMALLLSCSGGGRRSRFQPPQASAIPT